MRCRGLPDHLDLSVSDPGRSIPFYAAVLEYLGFARVPAAAPDRGCWGIAYRDGARFEIEVRPARHPGPVPVRGAPGLDHLAFHARDRADVDGLVPVLRSLGVTAVDPPAEYDYTPGYYAVGFDDPDGLHLEVVFQPEHDPGGG